MTEKEFDLVIIGGGPAGFTAGIYAGRAGLKTVILEKQMAGGQVMISPSIENWPGDKEISGPDLAMRMREHAETYVTIMEYSEVTSLRKEGMFFLETPEGNIKGKAVILATGAEHKKLGVPGENDLSGKGISYCATCDGFFFKGKEVVVVGGGSTALLYAIYLHNIECRVKLVHRRGEFRGEMALQNQVRDLGIELIMDTVVKEFKGNEMLETVVLKNVRFDEIKEIPISGAFIAIGEIPQTQLGVALGVKLNEEGFIEVDREMRTNVPGFYSAGDITGGLKQIVTATSEGAIAATSAFEDLMEPYWL